MIDNRLYKQNPDQDALVVELGVPLSHLPHPATDYLSEYHNRNNRLHD
jgi:hypothetical protein